MKKNKGNNGIQLSFWEQSSNQFIGGTQTPAPFQPKEPQHIGNVIKKWANRLSLKIIRRTGK